MCRWAQICVPLPGSHSLPPAGLQVECLTKVSMGSPWSPPSQSCPILVPCERNQTAAPPGVQGPRGYLQPFSFLHPTACRSVSPIVSTSNITPESHHFWLNPHPIYHSGPGPIHHLLLRSLWKPSPPPLVSLLSGTGSLGGIFKNLTHTTLFLSLWAPNGVTWQK